MLDSKEGHVIYDSWNKLEGSKNAYQKLVSVSNSSKIQLTSDIIFRKSMSAISASSMGGGSWTSHPPSSCWKVMFYCRWYTMQSWTTMQNEMANHLPQCLKCSCKTESSVMNRKAMVRLTFQEDNWLARWRMDSFIYDLNCIHKRLSNWPTPHTIFTLKAHPWVYI